MVALRALTTIAMAMLLAACGSLPAGGGATFPGELPALYAGVFPCRDCREVHYLLQLRPDGTFLQRTQFPGRPGLDDIGRWFVSSDGARLMLFGAKPGRDQFSFDRNGALFQQEADGRPLPQPATHRLSRVADVTPWQAELPLTGMYSFANGRARFEECLTGLTLAVADGPEARRLERGYFDARRNMGEQVMMSLRGRLSPVGTAASGARTSEALQLDVVKFELAMPGASCAPPPEAVPLQGTRWQLTELAGQPVVAVGGQPQPHLELVEGGSISGSTGCDALAGRYRLRGNQLSLDEVRAEATACPGDTVFQMMLTETLGTVRSWRMLGPLLELRDGSGRLVARFDAMLD